LGDGTNTTSPAPVVVTGSLSFHAIAAGDYHTCGLADAGAAYCWGSNYSGALGDGTTTNSAVPVAVSGGVGFTALAAGGGHTCGLAAAGKAYCWGGGGLLGDSSATPSPTPVAVSGGFAFTLLAAGTSHTCGIGNTGAAFCWGSNYYGQLGYGGPTGPSLGPNYPVAVVGGLVFTAIAAGDFHTCGITSPVGLYCWGLDYGSRPVPVSGSWSFVTLAAGYRHTCAVTDAGAAYCWGINEFGQLGVDGPFTPGYRVDGPVAVHGA
jgi:alpha-tubulin suppressor-like RCC1 family protein